MGENSRDDGKIRLQIYVTERAAKIAREMAHGNGLSVSALIELLIRSWRENQTQKIGDLIQSGSHEDRV